ncbi:MAG: citrate synthase family protein [Mesorhizobium sp.]
MKNSAAPLYLNAREAAAELSISPATLYAYVSRGLIRSEPVGDGRARRYRADDVRAMRTRRGAASAGAGSDAATAPVLDTSIGTITEAGPIYRGVPAVSLAETATLEQAATLLWNASGSDPFDRTNLPVLDGAMRQIMAATRAAQPLPRAIATLALASDADPRAHNRAPDGRARVGARALRLVTAGILGTEPSPEPIHQQVADAWMPGDPRAPELLRRALVLLADHELNASTWTVRCGVSTGLTLYDGLIAGLVALKGPRHGGAGPLAAMMAAELCDGDLAANIRERVALGERIAGFGHTVYKDGDPRADVLLAALVKAGADPRIAVEAPALITEATGLYPNIDYALAVLMRMFGLPVGHETALFAIARATGWIAHAIEQLESGALIRPHARYVGPQPGRGSMT